MMNYELYLVPGSTLYLSIYSIYLLPVVLSITNRACAHYVVAQVQLTVTRREQRYAKNQ